MGTKLDPTVRKHRLELQLARVKGEEKYQRKFQGYILGGLVIEAARRDKGVRDAVLHLIEAGKLTARERSRLGPLCQELSSMNDLEAPSWPPQFLAVGVSAS